MLEVPELHDGVRFFADGSHGGDNEQELARLRGDIEKDTAYYDENLHEAPETDYTVLDQIIASKKSFLALLVNPEKLWETEALAQFRQTGKYEQISLSDSGELTLTIILAGSAVVIKEQVDPQFVRPIREFIDLYDFQWGIFWAWKKDDDSDSDVDTFTRLIPLLQQKNGGQNIYLRWKGLRTKTLEKGAPYIIEDKLEIVTRAAGDIPDATTILDESPARIHQWKIVEQLRNHTDRIWHMDAFKKEGKYNCLRISPAGIVSLDIIKPGVHSRYEEVELAEHISAEWIQALRAELQKKSPTWENKLPQGFLAEWVTEHNEQSTFDESRKNKPGAVFVADRILDLGIIKDARRAVLHWIVRHENWSQEWSAVKVGDKFSFEWGEPLPQH
jgi:hypothetical protein